MVTSRYLSPIFGFFVFFSLGCIAMANETDTIETVEDYICRTTFKGCRVDYKQRNCVTEEAVGCQNPFPYEDEKECWDDFFFGTGNICDKQKPCLHDGICMQVTEDNHGRTFKCECANTGYYGHNCEKKCPFDLSAMDPQTLPCLQI